MFGALGSVLEFGRRCIQRRLIENTSFSYELGQNIVATKFYLSRLCGNTLRDLHGNAFKDPNHKSLGFNPRVYFTQCLNFVVSSNNEHAPSGCGYKFESIDLANLLSILVISEAHIKLLPFYGK